MTCGVVHNIRKMRITKSALFMMAMVAVLAACSAAPRGALAQGTTLVETLPPEDSTVRRSPFDMAAPNMPAAARLVGCYAVTLGPWSNLRAGDDSLPVPTRVDLVAQGHEKIYIGFRLVARTPGFAAERPGYPPAWGPIGADSLQARVWADGAGSVTLFLRRHADGELRGTVRAFTGARAEDSVTGRWLWEAYPAAPATLRAVPCEGTE